MAISVPKLVEIRDSIINDLKAKLGITASVFGKNFLYIFAGVLAGKLRLFYLTTAQVQKNIAPDLADQETLERWGRIKLGRNPNPALAGEYNCIFTGSIGAVIKASTTFKSNDNSSNAGVLLILDNEVTLASTSEVIELRSLELGSASALIVGDQLTATSPIVNVESIIEVDTIQTTPLDAESTEDYRVKVVESERLETQGGASSDFRLWSYDANGVRRSYPFAKSGESAVVDLFIEVAVADSTDGKGSAPQTVLDEVNEVIELDPDTTKPLEERGRRPLGVFDVDTQSVTPSDVVISISGLTDTSANIVTLINDALESYMDTVRPFVSGADVIENRNDTLNISRLSNVVVSAIPDNILFNSLAFSVAGVDTPQFKFTLGFIPYLDNVNIV